MQHLRWRLAALSTTLILIMLAVLIQRPSLLSASDDGQIIQTLPLIVELLVPTATRTPTPVNLGNFVWDDLDQDGRQDAGEPGMSGITVQLWNPAKTQLIGQTTTGANGQYTLIAPLPGSYRIRVVLPSVLDNFSPKDQAGGSDTADSDVNPSGSNIGFTDIINIASNVISISNLDAGIARFRTPTPTRTPTPINLGNYVWDDLDQDGRQDAGEPGYAGITVQLWNSAKTLMIASTVTSPTGNYTLIAPTPGNYRIRVVLPSVLDQFAPKNQAGGDDTADSDVNASGNDLGFTDTISLASNVISISNIDIGIVRFRTPTPTRTPTPINIGNFVWDDLDQDGRQDAGEPGIAGITVQLWNSAKTLMISSTVTNATGAYTVVAPLPGSYRIRVVLPAMLDQFAPKDQAGGNDTQDSDVNPSGNNLGFTDIINIASNVISISNIDIGIARYRTPTPTRTPTPINIGNFVWRDTDGDGRQDTNEVGISGVTVQLWNSAKTLMIASTVTNANGAYTVVAPLPGSYRIRVILPATSASFAPKDQAGGSDTQDSDINPTGNNAGFTDIINIASNVISISNVDAGIRQNNIIVPISTIGILPQPSATPGNQLPPPQINPCGGFRLTSPLDGLPNGVATFYWDPSISAGVTYEIRILNEARSLLAIVPAGTNTNVVIDVSQGTIGGGFTLIVQANVLLNGAIICTDEHAILRAALAAPPMPTPTLRRRGN